MVATTRTWSRHTYRDQPGQFTRGLLPEPGQNPPRGQRGVRGVAAATFHVVSRLLREHAQHFERTEQYTIYDQACGWRMRRLPRRPPLGSIDRYSIESPTGPDGFSC